MAHRSLRREAGRRNRDFTQFTLLQVKSYYPEFLEFFAEVACANALAFLCAYPDVDSAAQLSPEQVATFFKEHHLRNGKIVHHLYTRLHQRHLWVPPAVIEVKKITAVSCAKRLLALAPDIEHSTQRLTELVDQHPDGQIFLSYPGGCARDGGTLAIAVWR